MANAITPRATNYSNWYLDVILNAKLADYAPVRGCMVIRPRGYALWEAMQAELDAMFKETGHENAYFPLLIPEEYIHREADHIEGFAPELAVVTHGGGEKLEQPYIIRPTSETIIWSMYKQWIQSYRDLPLLLNQWANVLRWEKRTRLFLRTTEFLWQEGHTAHATQEEAINETKQIFSIYQRFARDYMAMYCVGGCKSEAERFAGAIETYAIEALMQDGKVIQAGTSHFLGQNFARVFDVQFQSESGSQEYVWASSWGVSTRLIGALIMTHSDDKGLVLPPKLAPVQVIIQAIFRSNTKDAVLPYAREVYQELSKDIRCELDCDEQHSPGWRFAEAELRGIPLRIEIGPRDIEKNTCVLARRDTGEKIPVARNELAKTIPKLLVDIQSALFARHKAFTETHTYYPEDYKALQKQYTNDLPGFCVIPWDGAPRSEQKLKSETKATIRVVLEEDPAGKTCLISGNPAEHMVIVGKAY